MVFCSSCPKNTSAGTFSRSTLPSSSAPSTVSRVVGVERVEGMRMGLRAVRVDSRDAEAVQVTRHELQLVAEFGRALRERPLHVPERAVRVGRIHLPVDEFGHAGFDGARAFAVRRNQPVDRRTDERPFLRVEEMRFVVGDGCSRFGCCRVRIWRGRAGRLLIARGERSCWNQRYGRAKETSARGEGKLRHVVESAGRVQIHVGTFIGLRWR